MQDQVSFTYGTATKITEYRNAPQNNTFDVTVEVASSKQLSQVISEGGKPPFKQNKRHEYRLVRYSCFRGETTLSSGDDFMYREIGTRGVQPPLYKRGDNEGANTAYNQCVSRLGDYVRTSVDLSIDAFQYKQLGSLIRKLTDVRGTLFNLMLKLPQSLPKGRPSRKYRNSSTANEERMRTTFFKKLKEKDRYDKWLITPMKELGSSYLEFTYGVQPTLQTIYDLVHQEATRVGNSLRIQTKQSDGSYKPHVRGKESYYDTEVESSLNAKVSTSVDSRYRCEIGGIYQPSPAYVESLSRLTSLNPLSIAWELVPFSFVVDWIFDMGGYLRGMETALLSNIYGSFDGFLSISEKHANVTSETYFGTTPYGFKITGGGTSNISEIIRSRTVLSGFPYPRPPQFKAELGGRRLLNAAALLTNLLGLKTRNKQRII